MATQSTGRLAGKTAVLTGGTAGIGLETSLMVTRQGARMAIIEIQKDAGRETARLIQSILLET